MSGATSTATEDADEGGIVAVTLGPVELFFCPDSTGAGQHVGKNLPADGDITLSPTETGTAVLVVFGPGGIADAVQRITVVDGAAPKIGFRRSGDEWEARVT